MMLSSITEHFNSNFLEVIKFDALIELIKTASPNISTQFIIDSLDVEREKLESIDHDIPLIFVRKNVTFEIINGKNFIPPVGNTIYDWGRFFDNEEKEIMPTYDYQEWNYGLTFKLLNYYPINRSTVYAGINLSNRRGIFETFDFFNEWLDKFHSNLEQDDIYILKQDALSLISDLIIPNEHVFLIQYNRFIASCNRSDEFFDMGAYEEFQNSGACDLAFEIWTKDKEIFEKITNKNERFLTPKDSTIAQQQIEIPKLKARIAELERKNQNTAQNKAIPEQPPKYNPTERETHLLMINALINIITKPNFRAGAAKYLKANRINQKTIYEEVAQGIKETLNNPETKERSEEAIKKRLKEAMALETKQAD